MGHAHTFDRGEKQVVLALHAISFKTSVWMRHGQAQANYMAVNLNAQFPFWEGNSV